MSPHRKFSGGFRENMNKLRLLQVRVQVLTALIIKMTVF
jgi:hypothetical protein